MLSFIAANIFFVTAERQRDYQRHLVAMSYGENLLLPGYGNIERVENLPGLLQGKDQHFGARRCAGEGIKERGDRPAGIISAIRYSNLHLPLV
jgi:hypothetical protein